MTQFVVLQGPAPQGKSKVSFEIWALTIVFRTKPPFLRAMCAFTTEIFGEIPIYHSIPKSCICIKLYYQEVTHSQEVEWWKILMVECVKS